MTITTTIEPGFATEEGDPTRPDRLIFEVIANDEVPSFRFQHGRRSWLTLGTVGVYEIPLSQLGYFGITSVGQITDLWFQPTGQARQLVSVIDVGDFLPDKMTSGFTFGNWSSTNGGRFNIAVSSPPTSPDTILSYLIQEDGTEDWSVVVPVADLPEDIPFTPLTYPDWQFGVTTFNVGLTIAATIAAGTAVPSDPVSK